MGGYGGYGLGGLYGGGLGYGLGHHGYGHSYGYRHSYGHGYGHKYGYGHSYYGKRSAGDQLAQERPIRGPGGAGEVGRPGGRGRGQARIGSRSWRSGLWRSGLWRSGLWRTGLWRPWWIRSWLWRLWRHLVEFVVKILKSMIFKLLVVKNKVLLPTIK